jgi:hypothetical protein
MEITQNGQMTLLDRVFALMDEVRALRLREEERMAEIEAATEARILVLFDSLRTDEAGSIDTYLAEHALDVASMQALGAELRQGAEQGREEMLDRVDRVERAGKELAVRVARVESALDALPPPEHVYSSLDRIPALERRVTALRSLTPAAVEEIVRGVLAGPLSLVPLREVSVSLDDVLRWISNERSYGVAHKLARAFRELEIQTVEEAIGAIPERLRTVNGVGSATVRALTEALAHFKLSGYAPPSLDG